MRADVKPTPEKRCSICGARFQRKVLAGGRLEDRTAFLKRQFCSLSCANSRSKGGLSRKAFHAQARKHRAPNCEICGSAQRLHVHHVNEDWTDNSLPNLQTLCVFCHQFWHATHRRLGAKPWSRMPPIASLLQVAQSTGSDDCAATVTPSSRRKPKPSSKP